MVSNKATACQKIKFRLGLIHFVRFLVLSSSKSSLRDVLFIVRAGSDIIKADFMHIKRTTFSTKMKTGILLEELK